MLAPPIIAYCADLLWPDKIKACTFHLFQDIRIEMTAEGNIRKLSISKFKTLNGKKLSIDRYA